MSSAVFSLISAHCLVLHHAELKTLPKTLNTHRSPCSIMVSMIVRLWSVLLSQCHVCFSCMKTMIETRAIACSYEWYRCLHALLLCMISADLVARVCGCSYALLYLLTSTSLLPMIDAHVHSPLILSNGYRYEYFTCLAGKVRRSADSRQSPSDHACAVPV